MGISTAGPTFRGSYPLDFVTPQGKKLGKAAPGAGILNYRHVDSQMTGSVPVFTCLHYWSPARRKLLLRFRHFRRPWRSCGLL
jgi:hypothetical protein